MKISVYSPVAGITGLRIIIHCSITYFESNLQAIDVKTAFLNARTPTARYFNLPLGHKNRLGTTKVWKTYCALYGLTDSSYHWYKCLVNFLKKLNLEQCMSEECLFTLKSKTNNKLELLILIYVDDILLTGTNEKITWFTNNLSNRFNIRKTTEASSFIGIQIMKNKNYFKLVQKTLTRRLLINLNYYKPNQ